jgi:hypothetical protein
MKKWIALLLALAMLIVPVAALAWNPPTASSLCMENPGFFRFSVTLPAGEPNYKMQSYWQGGLSTFWNLSAGTHTLNIPAGDHVAGDVWVIEFDDDPSADATATGRTDPCAVPVVALNLTFMQPCKPAEGTPALAEWRITNPNAFSVAYTVDKAGTGQILSGTAPAGQSFFTTPWGTQTLILKWAGGQKNKAGGDTYNGTDCDEPQPPPPPEEECVLTPMYYQHTFVKEGFPNCYLVTWDQKDNGDFWPAASRSQLCNCNWPGVADDVVAGGWVYRDCRGTWWYDGKVWAYGKPDMVLPHWDRPCASGGGGGECAVK